MILLVTLIAVTADVLFCDYDRLTSAVGNLRNLNWLRHHRGRLTYPWRIPAAANISPTGPYDDSVVNGVISWFSSGARVAATKGACQIGNRGGRKWHVLLRIILWKNTAATLVFAIRAGNRARIVHRGN